MFRLYLCVFIVSTACALSGEKLPKSEGAKKLRAIDDASAALLKAAASDDSPASILNAKEALQKGADINARDPGSKQTALMSAALSGHVKMVHLCLKKGADTTIPEKDGYTPMHGAGSVLGSFSNQLLC
jgi:ankyrin repeat protein